jgi:hypothetical protein
VLAALGVDFIATMVAPSAMPAYPIGARIEVPVTRAILAYWREATRVGDVLYVDFADSPLAAGEYNLVWRDSGPEGPGERTEFEVFVPLVVV